MPTSASSYAMAMPHSPAQSWSFRVPSPPRIIVPPPMLNSNGLPDLNVVGDSTTDFECNGFANAEFLKKVTYNNFMTTNNMLEWKYEQRRMAQQILPFLYLGPISVAKDKYFLQKTGVTMVLVVRNTMSAQARLLGAKAAEEMGLDTKMVDVAGNQELIAAFPKAIELINVHLSTRYQDEQMKGLQAIDPNHEGLTSTPGKVLVSCETGNERSAALVTAYLMAMYAVDLIKAIQIVQAQRFAIAFDDSLRNLLSTYEIMLQAKRDVVQANAERVGLRGTFGGSVLHTKSANDLGNSSKRPFDDVRDEDMDLDGNDEHLDVERFETRGGSAPFQDKCGL